MHVRNRIAEGHPAVICASSMEWNLLFGAKLADFPVFRWSSTSNFNRTVLLECAVVIVDRTSETNNNNINDLNLKCLSHWSHITRWTRCRMSHCSSLQFVKEVPKRWRSMAFQIVVLFFGDYSEKMVRAQEFAQRHGMLFFSPDEKKPFNELRAELAKSYSCGSPSGKCMQGIVLHNCVGSCYEEIFYVDHVLNTFGLKINVAVNMESRKDSPDSRELLVYKRVCEDLCHFYFDEKAVRYVHCDGHSTEEINAAIDNEIETARHCETIHKLPRPLVPGYDLPMVKEYEKFLEVRNSMQEVVGTPRGKYDFFPGYCIQTYLNETTFHQKRRYLPQYYVTVKADGLRVIAVFTQGQIFLFPMRLVSMYHFPPQWLPACITEELSRATTKVAAVFDCELVEIKEEKRCCLLVFDYLYLLGSCGSATSFVERKASLEKLFAQCPVESSCISFKIYEPVGSLDNLLRSKYPFETDGLIFQPPLPYHYVDKNVMKWKPKELCTVDLRVAKKVLLPDGSCTFELLALDNEKETRIEGSLIVKQEDLSIHELREGMIVECYPSSASVWSFVRCRPDKFLPNRIDIVSTLLEMASWTVEKLRQNFVGLVESVPTQK